MKEPFVRILTLHFPLLSQEAALSRALEMAAARRPSAIFTPNAEMACRAAQSPAFSTLLNGADMLLPDGVGITLAAKRQGVTLPRMAGIDFAEELMRRAPAGGLRLFLLGARPGVGQEAAKVIEARYPRVRICGVQDGYFPAAMDAAVAGVIRAAAPDLLFVCLGSPRQEEWIAARHPPCLAIGLGGALDVWAGRVRRAPIPVQKAGLEWLWRTAAQPARLARLPALAAFSLRVFQGERGKRP